MKFSIIVKPKARKTFVEKISDAEYRVSVTEPPIDGQANNAVIHALARYFSVPKSHVNISSGEKGKHKIIEIL